MSLEIFQGSFVGLVSTLERSGVEALQCLSVNFFSLMLCPLFKVHQDGHVSSWDETLCEEEWITSYFLCLVDLFQGLYVKVRHNLCDKFSWQVSELCHAWDLDTPDLTENAATNQFGLKEFFFILVLGIRSDFVIILIDFSRLYIAILIIEWVVDEVRSFVVLEENFVVKFHWINLVWCLYHILYFIYTFKKIKINN